MKKLSRDKKLSTDKRLSNDMVDGIAAVILITLLVSGVVYWLQTM